MKTYFEIVAGKNYRELTAVEKEMIQDRQTYLVTRWQDETDHKTKLVIEDELHASFKGLIKGMAYKQSEKSFSLDQEEFEGIISLALVETMVEFDRTLNKPFQPVFIMNVRYAILEMYRDKGYDLHDTSDRLDKPNTFNAEGSSDTELPTYGDLHLNPVSFADDLETAILTDELLTDLFGENDMKKTIVHMTVQGFKRNEIVSAVNMEGKSTDAMAKQVNRTVKQFKDYYLNLLETQAI
jgi:hypothetical protein